ncbi:MAG: transposase [Armatimonadetes bacterium]|nr:transposase [Armatimonadota bacterium]
MARYRHWKNLAQGGQTVFITATALDFVAAFERAEVKRVLLDSLISDHRKAGAVMHAYAIMQNHVHIITTLPLRMSAAGFMRRVKLSSSKRLRPLLDLETQNRFRFQRGLNRRVIWQRSFRSKIIEGEAMFLRLLAYIHDNPVKAGLCAKPEEYFWSSARLFEEGRWNPEMGLMDAVKASTSGGSDEGSG